MKKIMRKILSILLVSLLAAVPALSVNASDNTDEVKTVRISDNHEIVTVGDVTVEDITTDEYRKIVTTQGDDISVYYEDFSTGMATHTVNGVLTDTFDMNEMRKNGDFWRAPQIDLGFALVITALFLLGLLFAILLLRIRRMILSNWKS